MNTARDQYLEHLALRRGAGSCWWNAVILTASSPRQADSYRQEIELRKEQGRLPAGVLYLVVPAPRGDRIGSGGATLTALRCRFGQRILYRRSLVAPQPRPPH